MRAFLLFFILLAFPGISRADHREDAQVLLSRAEMVTDPVERLRHFSKVFIGRPYGMNGPLGEGDQARYDQDPLYRFDTFDCTTFVETVVSLSRSRNVDAFELEMNRIRYEGGEVEFLKRNHFPSLQWIPNNLKNGTFNEGNSFVLGEGEQKLAEAVIDIAAWLKKSAGNLVRIDDTVVSEREARVNELRRAGEAYVPVLATLSYLPIERLLREPLLLRKIPDGSVISFVRPNWDLTASLGTKMNVSHQGLVFRSPSGPVLRHASPGGEKVVVEVSLLQYLKGFQNHPTMKGIHLLSLKN
jgi:hypothetical protein